MNPKHLGRIENASGVGDTANLRCGDIMKIYIKVAKRKGEEYIKDIKFETLGCGTAIATSDMICELAKGKSLKQAAKITYNDVAAELGEMPAQKLHCAGLAETALKAAIKNYESKKGE